MSPDKFGETDRLDPDDARRFIDDLVQQMRRRSWEIAQDDDSPVEMQDRNPDDDQSDLPSEAKQYYGDTWTFIYGISTGMRLMDSEHMKELDWEQGKEINHGINGDDSWQEHYDHYGYGVYGRGLKIGKRLAFYEDRDFTFSEGESESETEGFTIKSYD